MGQSESNVKPGLREIRVKNLKQRMNKEELKNLEDEFARLQEAGVS